MKKLSLLVFKQFLKTEGIYDEFTAFLPTLNSRNCYDNLHTYNIKTVQDFVSTINKLEVSNINRIFYNLFVWRAETKESRAMLKKYYSTLNYSTTFSKTIYFAAWTALNERWDAYARQFN